MQPTPLTDRDYDHYVVYRLRLRDFVHLLGLWGHIRTHPSHVPDIPGVTAEGVRGTLRTATLGWLASFVDSNPDSLNVLKLWSRFFPSRAADIRALKKVLLPRLPTLRQFRNEVAFHADQRLSSQLAARTRVRSPELLKAAENFLTVAKALVAEERTHPELVRRLSALGL